MTLSAKITDLQGLEVMIRNNEKVARFVVALLTICGATQLIGMGTGHADETRVRKKFNDKIMVVQPKPVLQRNRVDIVPNFQVSLNDQAVTNYTVGAQINFHILESLYVGAGFDWGNFGDAFGGKSSFAKQVEASSGASIDGIKLDYYAFADIGYVPIMGKLAIFNSAIGYYDVAVNIGGGYVGYRSLLANKPLNTFGGHIGLASRFFLADWVALNVFARDTIFMAEFNPNQSSLTNIFTIGVGFSIYVPFGFEYSQEELNKDKSLKLTDKE